MILGFLSAYYWSAILALVAVPVAYMLLYAGIAPAFVALGCTMLSSILGGFLGARVEQSRVARRNARGNS